jgi:hypothetical protein
MYNFVKFMATKKGMTTVWFHMNLFYIERGFYSRTEIGEREIDGSTVHIMNAVGDKKLCDSPPPPLSL